jgi:hypothetical protein
MIPRISDKRIGMAAAVILLWVVNMLNLQPFEFELSTTVAISQQRIPQLLLLRQSQSPSSQVRLLECKLLANDETTQAELQSARLRVRTTRYESLAELENWLEAKTRPVDTSSRCKQLRSQILNVQWNLESVTHTMTVLQRDRERENEQLAVEDPKPKSAFQLVGFSKSDPQQKECPVVASLSEQHRNCTEQLIKLQNDLETEHSQSIGFLRFSGAPKQYPVVQSVGVKRGTAFVILCLAVWGTIGIVAVRPIAFIRFLLSLRTIVVRATTSRSPQLEIPFLGEVIVRDDIASRAQGIKMIGSSETLAHDSVDAWRFRLFAGARALLMSGLVLWACVVVGRFVLDGAWRQLFLTAPLAGLSHVIGGIP